MPDDFTAFGSWEQVDGIPIYEITAMRRSKGGRKRVYRQVVYLDHLRGDALARLWETVENKVREEMGQA